MNARIPLFSMPVVLLFGCVSVYTPKHPDFVHSGCGRSPLSAETAGYHEKQNKWNDCAEAADRRFVHLQRIEALARAKREGELLVLAADEEQQRIKRAAARAHDEKRQADAAERERKIARLQGHQVAVAAGRAKWNESLAATRELAKPHMTSDELAAWEASQMKAWSAAEAACNAEFRANRSTVLNVPVPVLPEKARVAIEAAEREQAEAAAARRDFASRLDEVALERGLPNDEAFTTGPDDTTLVYRTLQCSRQWVHKAVKGARAKLAKRGFTQFGCVGRGEWYEDLSP